MDVLLSVKSKSDGAEQQLRCAVDGGITLGRSPDCPVALNGTGISRDHARVDLEGAGLVITDLSSNGTWVNGKRVPRGSPVAVKQDDSIEVPGYEIRVHILEEKLAPARAVAAGPAVAAQQGAPAGRWWKQNPASRYLLSYTGLERFVMAIAALSLLLTFVSF